MSTGITGNLSIWGIVVIIFVMFVGRIGLLTFGLAILARKNKIKTIEDETDLAV